jgi:hypothetical protein
MLLRSGAALAALSLASFCRAADPSGAAQGRWETRFDRLEGPVELRPAGQKAWTPAAKKAALKEGDAVRVLEGGSVDIAYGATAITHLRPGASVVLEKLEKEDTVLRLEAGTLLQKLQRLVRARWRVRTGRAVCAVRGTEFGVQTSTDGATTAGVFDEGEVSFSPFGDSGEPLDGRLLKPNQEADVRSSGFVGQAHPLRALRAYRAHMRELRKRLAAIQREYRTAPLRKRNEFRRRMGGE